MPFLRRNSSAHKCTKCTVKKVTFHVSLPDLIYTVGIYSFILKYSLIQLSDHVLKIDAVYVFLLLLFVAFFFHLARNSEEF